MTDRHHLLECILWPNGDGTFRKIINTEDRLRELWIYDDWKLTIPIEHRMHISMHHSFKRGTKYSMEGERGPLYGFSESKHPTWKGDDVGPEQLYRRALKRFRAGTISFEEFSEIRKRRQEYVHANRSTFQIAICQLRYY